MRFRRMLSSVNILPGLSLVAVLPLGAQSLEARNGSASISALAPAAARHAIPEYRIEAGDVLGVEVWKEPDLSIASVPVRLDGKISLPMLGQTEAAGLTPGELQESLVAKYGEYVRAPRVTVLLKEINSQKAYVIGEVKKEGFVRLSSPITVLQALAECGGLTDFANRGKIHILRAAGGKETLLPFDYSAVVRGKKMEQNIVLLPGDTVVVPH
jgi:polysaccharide export outer membrane protein